MRLRIFHYDDARRDHSKMQMILRDVLPSCRSDCVLTSYILDGEEQAYNDIMTVIKQLKEQLAKQKQPAKKENDGYKK